MAQNLFSLDGKYYNLRITEISRDGNILDGKMPDEHCPA